jgi:ATP-dependent Clp protease adaptor protein ClpS
VSTSHQYFSKPLAVHGDEDTGHDERHDLAVKEGDPEVQRPPMYRVLLLNDDFTPMEFVVHVLESFFGMDRHRAVRVMLAVHTEGKGVCGTYTREVAESRVAQVNAYSREHHHPLLCTMEVE